MTPLAIITASPFDRRAILEQNLLQSPCIKSGQVPLVVAPPSGNVPWSYNRAVEGDLCPSGMLFVFNKIINDGYCDGTDGSWRKFMSRCVQDSKLLAFIHDDVILPAGWPERLQEQIALVEKEDPNWGVIGCAGVRGNGAKYKVWAGSLWDRDQPYPPVGWETVDKLPAQVDTLDECVLVTRGKGDRFGCLGDNPFSTLMPSGHHLFGADLCLGLRQGGLKAYAIDAPVQHNSTAGRMEIPVGFYVAAGYLLAKYPDMMPIHTTCLTMVMDDDGVVQVSI